MSRKCVTALGRRWNGYYRRILLVRGYFTKWRGRGDYQLLDEIGQGCQYVQMSGGGSWSTFSDETVGAGIGGIGEFRSLAFWRMV